MEITVTKEQLELIKRHLRITFSDKDVDKNVEEIIEDATVKLNDLLGREFDYFRPSAERRLFLAYCSYLYNDCEEEFEPAYQRDINRIRRKAAVMNEKQEKI